MIATAGGGLTLEQAHGNALLFVVLRMLRTLMALLVLAGVFFAWRVVMPEQIGGSSTYVMVSGSSMLPLYKAGDAVILRTRPSYHVGEVIAYYNPQLKIDVMHRIYEIKNGHYLMKGDNNNFIDPYQPTLSNIVGARWLHISGAGWVLYEARQPPIAGALAGALGVLFVTGRKGIKRRRYRIETQAKL